MFGMYGVCLIAAAALGCAAFYPRAKRMGLHAAAAPALTALYALMGALCGRAYLHITKYAINGRGMWGYTVLSSRPYEYAVCGVILGVMLAAWIASKALKKSAWQLLDAMAPAALLALAAARFGEYFADFGWGQVLEGGSLCFFPFAVSDMYGMWHAAVFMLEGALALAVFVYALCIRREREGDAFRLALLWWCAAQVFCESMRAETLRWGFVRVQQLQCAVFMLGLLITFTLRAKRLGLAKRTAPAYYVFVVGVGVVIFIEYALDKIQAMPVALCYGIMAAALCAMAGMIARQRRLGEFKGYR